MGTMVMGMALRESLGWMIALSVLMILAGVLAIIVPPVASIGVTLVFGWLLAFSGVMHLVFAWRTHTAGGLIWELLLGILYIGVGGYLLLRPAAGLVSLTLALAIYLFAEGILEVFFAFVSRPLPGSGWILLDGIITLVLGVMIWRTWPSDAEWVIGLLVGISMLFSGITRLMLPLTARRMVRRLA